MTVRAHGRGPPGTPTHRRNADADWDRWPVDAYLDESYRRIHPSDAAVIRHHAGPYRTLAPGSVARSLECGAGPNLLRAGGGSAPPGPTPCPCWRSPTLGWARAGDPHRGGTAYVTAPRPPPARPYP